jgi:hypothetical protein
MKYRQRLIRLETYQRQRNGRSHYLSVVQYPWNLPDGDRDRWLREDLLCACGQVGCPLLAIGALLPAKAPSAEAWTERVQAYYARKRDSHA